MPLTLPVHVVCNTSDEEIYQNIKENSHNHPKGWIKMAESHDGVAIIVGSAPSLLDTLGKIKELQSNGGKVFALNNACSILNENGIHPDYQVMLDARERTSELVGDAKEYLFASQLHPSCFAKAKNPTLWHLQVENIEDYLPEYDDEYALIGGAASVGNTAICLAFAMGYLDLQIFGLDSCHRDGKGHAKHQAINDGDPVAVVSYGGKQYTASLTMKLQAERFQDTARLLQNAGVRIELHGDGLLQEMWRNPQLMTESEKYTMMWSQPEYRVHSPAAEIIPFYLEKFKPEGMVLDFGCGSGKAAAILHNAGYDVTLLDFTENSRDEEAQGLPFFKQDLTNPIPHKAKHGYCIDVMEHLPPESVSLAITNIMASADAVFFQISTVPDMMGSLIGQELHLTVKPHQWWRDLFISLGYVIEWEEEQNIASLFYIKKGVVNG